MLRQIIFLSGVLSASWSLADSIVPAGQQEDAKVALGYNTDKQVFRGECLKGKVEQHGQAKANVSFSQTVSESELEKELGFEAGGKFRYGAAKIGVAAKYLKSQRSNNYSIVAVYSGDYKFKNLLLTFEDSKDPNAKPADIEKMRLSDVGLSVRKDDLKWSETCGDEYVQQIERGAKLFYSIRIDFSSQEEKDLFETSFSYDSSYASVHAHLKNSKTSFSKNTKVTIGALQIGGDVRRVTEMFSAKEGSGEEGPGSSMGFVQCSFGDFSKCDGVMARAWEYATQDFKEQLKYDPDKPTNEEGPAYINYITKDYSAAGIYAKFSSVLQKAVINKRAEIEQEFDRQVLLSAQVDHLLNGKTVVLSKRQNKLLKDVQITVKKNIDILIKAAEICYSEIGSCVDMGNDQLAKVQPIGEDVFVVEPEDYRQYCEMTASVMAEKALRDSIKGMIQAAKDLEPEAFTTSSDQPINECLISDMVFSRNAVIGTFKKQGIRTLSPLREYTHFEYVDFSENEIEDLRPIEGWNNLEEINLHDNKLREIDSLAKLLNLRKVRVSNNALRDIEMLLGLPYLVRIDARNNYPTVSCKNFTAIDVCMSTSVKTDSNFVPIKTTSVVPLFMPSVAMMKDDTVFITGLGSVGSRFLTTSNTFTSTAAMAQVSYGAQTTALSNGNVLVAGGWGSPQQMFEYNPFTNEMTAVGPLVVGRADQQMVLLKDGRVLITGGWENPNGGWTGANASYTAEIYDPETRVSSLLPKMTSPRAWHTATLLENGNVLLVGGFSHASSLASVEIFEVGTEKFVQLGKSMSEGRGGHTATVLDDGEVLIAGGFIKYGEATPHAEIYSPVTGSFKKVIEPLNYARGHHVALRLGNGKVLISGGSKTIFTPNAPLQGSAGSGMYDNAEIYDPSENSFAVVPTKMYVPRARHAMVEIKPGMVLVVGGLDIAAATNSEVFVYTDTEVNLFPLL